MEASRLSRAFRPKLLHYGGGRNIYRSVRHTRVRLKLGEASFFLGNAVVSARDAAALVLC